MPIARGQTGFQPPARDAERRAFFDLLRRIKALEDAAPGGGGGEPLLGDHLVDPVDAHDARAVSFVPTGTISATNVQDAIVEAAAEGGGGGGMDEVFIGPSDPGGTYELWYDSDAAGGGGTVMASYVHNQGTPAATWVIVHNLSGYPNVTVEDSGGTTVEGEIVYNNANQLTLTFSAAFGGAAYLS